MTPHIVNDREREIWVLNDESLYLACLRWRRFNTGGMRGFIRAFRGEIDRVIRGAKGE